MLGKLYATTDYQFPNGELRSTISTHGYVLSTNISEETPKALNSKAQGRAAHPGYTIETKPKTPQGFHKWSEPMGQSLVQIYVHIVFSTKERQPFLRDASFRERTHAYLKGICDNQGSPSLRIGGTEDHVHILCRLSKTLDMSTLIRELKRDSSKWIKEENPLLADFYWQQGYGAFSVSPSHVPALKEYIANQEEHHRRETFQDEFRRLCKKYGVEFDERYVWE